MHKEKCHLRGSGVVQVAIYQKTTCPRITVVGAGRKMIQSLSQAFRLTRVVKLAAEKERGNVRILVSSPATLDPVRLAPIWDQHRSAFAVSTK